MSSPSYDDTNRRPSPTTQQVWRTSSTAPDAGGPVSRPIGFWLVGPVVFQLDDCIMKRCGAQCHTGDRISTADNVSQLGEPWEPGATRCFSSKMRRYSWRVFSSFIFLFFLDLCILLQQLFLHYYYFHTLGVFLAKIAISSCATSRQTKKKVGLFIPFDQSIIDLGIDGHV